ncbi:HD-GYP domain-containing protein [Spirochaeta isovalerica]|uniref:Putative two-component system response regulator n=1 Tax=Spirochaeta isovalerica TaxID=150 RepID=A0A841R6M5_9SPIO|nr:HD-GYP domain-containing protein [Spirochaeta isovalerica]MBB6478690.1 putative two-component system response regulator [Spirochaeta isovalerica]
MNDLEEIYEIPEEPEEILDISSQIDLGFPETVQSECWKNRYDNVAVPSLILDSSLNVIWMNSAFKSLLIDDQKYQIKHITQYFPNIKEIKKLKEIYNTLKDKNSGYSWKGRVVSKNQKTRSEVANIIIIPLDFDESQTPATYSAVLDLVTDEYREMLRNMFSSLLEASKLKDNDTGNHIERVNQYSRFIADVLKSQGKHPEIDEDYLEDIGFLAAMHDVGKIGTPDDILNKNGSLEPWEREVMNEHTKNGAYILSTYPNQMAKQIALHHHEKWDGTGYPFGMANHMIPLCARIVALADVYDALRMKRSYKDSFSHEKTKGIIKDLSGTHFDPDIVKIFLAHDLDFDNIFTSLTDNE